MKCRERFACLILGLFMCAWAAEARAEETLPDAEALAQADYAAAAEIWAKRKDKGPDAAWRAEASAVAAAAWPKALAALNKQIAPDATLEAYLPGQRLKTMPVKSFDPRAGVVLDMGKGATTSVMWKNVSVPERLALMQRAAGEGSPEDLRARYCLAALHGSMLEAGDLYEQAGSPAAGRGLVEAHLAGASGKLAEARQRAFVNDCLAALEKFKEAGQPEALDAFLRIYEARLSGNPFAGDVKKKVEALKAEFAKAKPAAEANAPAAGEAPAAPAADGRRAVFNMDFSRPNWGKIVPVNGNDYRGEVIADPTGGSGKVLSAKMLYEVPGSYLGAAAHTELPGNAFYTVGPNTLFEVEVYYEGMTDPSAFLDVKGTRGDQKVTGRVPLGELKEKTWQKVAVLVAEGKIVAYQGRDNDLPKDGDRLILISFHADLGCTRRVQKLYFRRLTIYELPPKK
ncbi:MAG: hypothetical protein KIS92_15660 [Planctomycetota bacterium]|nr:hypothetical protein [Planctomycetota bacterium]